MKQSKALCQVHGSMGEFGVYDIHLAGDAGNATRCDWSTSKEPVDIYMRKRNRAPRRRRRTGALSKFRRPLSIDGDALMVANNWVLIFYAALLACFLFYVALAAVWMAGKAAHRRGLFDGPLRFAGLANYATTAGPADDKGATSDGDTALPLNVQRSETKKKRLKSLDTFRG